MKDVLIAAAAVILVSSSQLCPAQNLTTAVSVSLNSTQSQVCDSTACSAQETISASVKQELEFSAIQVTELGPGTSVTIQLAGAMMVDGRIGDDPNYTPGDGSVKIENAILKVSSRTYPATMQLSWSDTAFKISVKAKGTRPIPLGPIIIESVEASPTIAPGDLPPGHPLATQRIRTSIRNGSTVVAGSEAFFAIKATDTKKTLPLKDGGARIDRKLSMKSSYQVTPTPI